MERITITVQKELLDWLDDKVTAGRFASRSHGVRCALMELKAVHSEESEHDEGSSTLPE